MRRRGLTLIEIIITVVVLVFGTFVVISTFSMDLRQSTQSRERLMAALVMENLLEEVLAHPYGSPIPSSWQNHPVELTFIVEGRPQQTVFTRTVSQNKNFGNGSFFGTGAAGADSDKVDLLVTWVEASGQGSSGVEQSLSLELTVRREL